MYFEKTKTIGNALLEGAPSRSVKQFKNFFIKDVQLILLRGSRIASGKINIDQSSGNLQRIAKIGKEHADENILFSVCLSKPLPKTGRLVRDYSKQNAT